MFFDNDLQTFFTDFAEPCVINSNTIEVLFDSQQVQYQEGFSTVVGYQPTITLKTADALANNVEQGVTLTVRGKSYTVSNIEEDGTGISTATLYKN